jgi:hypothetical protein
MIKRNSKTHLKIRFSFFAPFRARLASKFAKSADISLPIVLAQIGVINHKM